MSEPSEAVGPDGASPGGPCVDRSMVDGMREALQDDSLVVELAGSFLRDTPQRLQALAAALLDDRGVRPGSRRAARRSVVPETRSQTGPTSTTSAAWDRSRLARRCARATRAS